MHAASANDIADLLDDAQRLVQRGDVEAAERTLSHIRSVISLPDHPKLAARVMIIEGCSHAYRGEWSRANDRLERANIIAKRLIDSNCEHLSEAWLAYISFIQSDFKRCIYFSYNVLSHASIDHGLARFRASAVVALMHYYAGDRDRAESWFGLVKAQAESLHDTSITSVMIYDIAAIRASARRIDCLGSVDPDKSACSLDLVFARSASNFDALGSIRVMSSLHELLEAQVLNSLGRFSEASAVLRSSLASPESFPGVSEAHAKLELYWAMINSDDVGEAAPELQDWSREISRLVDDDDLSVYCARASRAATIRGQHDAARSFEEQSQLAILRLGESRRRLIADLEPFGQLLSNVTMR